MSNSPSRALTPVPERSQVLQAVLEYAGAETLPLVADVVDELLRLLDDAASGGAALPGLIGVDGGGVVVGGARPASSALPEPPALLPCLRALHALVLAAREFGAPPPDAAETVGGVGAAEGEAAGEAESEEGEKGEEGEEAEEVASGGSGPAAGEVGLADFFDELLRHAEAEEGVVPPEGCGRCEAGAGAEAEAEPDDGEAGEGEDGEAGEEDRRARREREAREQEEEEERRRTPPLAPRLVLQVVARAEVLLLSGSAATSHLLLGSLAAQLVPQK